MDSIEPVSNDGEEILGFRKPYVVAVTIEGVCPILFHRWSVESVAAKSAAAKGSAAKKSDDVESYVNRCDDGTIGIPGEYVRQAIAKAAKFRQDPRSPRKSAFDLYKAAVACLSDISPILRDGKSVTDWEYLDQRRVMVQRNGVTRQRPAFHKGWQAQFDFQVIAPEYIDAADLRDVLINAGRLEGVGDFRPTYGRFDVVSFERTI